jgi:hypothetical protein
VLGIFAICFDLLLGGHVWSLSVSRYTRGRADSCAARGINWL